MSWKCHDHRTYQEEKQPHSTHVTNLPKALPQQSDRNARKDPKLVPALFRKPYLKLSCMSIVNQLSQFGTVTDYLKRIHNYVLWAEI